jgi:hypothetical protein
MAGTWRAPIRTLCLSSGLTMRAYRALRQTGVSTVHVGEHLSQRDALGRLQLTVMVANRTREIRPSGMKWGACGNVGVMGDGLRPIGKSMESPPDPTMLRAPHFYPDQSGNPSGRPPGIRDKRTAMRALLEPHADALVAKAVELALAGDGAALRICIERLIPAVKAKDDAVSLPPLTGSLADQGRVIVEALAQEKLSPEEASTILQALATQARIVEVSEIEKRVSALEKIATGKEATNG